ncbi:MAG TPA: hypothetical protein VGO56_21310 [Pyrinomonadaceae bacterium]|jgi:hypothetical protein|nr:hypothetical protein [Pyrinomonadaceae bacterium]
MKSTSLAGLLLVVAVSLVGTQAQTSPGKSPSASPDPRVKTTPAPRPNPPAEPESDDNEPTTPQGVVVGTTPDSRPEAAGPAATERHGDPLEAGSKLLSPPQIQSRIAEAERLLKSRPLQTAKTSPAVDLVTLAALDRNTSRIHLITIYKDVFLTKGSEVTSPSSLGTTVTIRVIRANGVNTAVAIFDAEGRSLVPLVVEFPIEKRGVFREMAYYTSAHPALLSPDLSRSGRAYVHRMIDLALKRLKEKGVFISPQIVDVAERLCLVEHVDHDRFRLENRLALFDEIYSLFALNEPDTYRYSVSTAGAGGMVQMIPWAYNLVRQRHPGVGLTPDFVVGMRNHGNALQAMLLYMQDTWNELGANEDVQYALDAKLATQTELLAAGYNSNAARLPLYIRRGGASWKTLIPRETQIYLQIYKTLEALVPQKSHSTTSAKQNRDNSARRAAGDSL